MTMPPAPRPEADASDGMLVRRVAEGDDDALEALYDRYGRPAFALARRITGEPVFAEEVVQEVFLALWRDPEKYDPDPRRLPQLAAGHHPPQGGRRGPPGGDRAAPACVAGRGGGDVHLGRRRPTRRWRTRRGPVCAASGSGRRSARCREPQREALVLAYYAGYTQREIAERTNTPLGTVKTRMLAGMRRLRDLLDGVSDTEGARP